MPEKATQSAQHPRHRRRGLSWTVTAFVLLGAGVTLFLVPAILMHRAGGILRHRIINTLSTRFEARVQLPEFNVSVWHGFEVTGHGLKIWANALAQQQPLIAVDSFRFHTAWWQLLRSPMHVGTVALSGLVINMPSANQRSRMPAGTPPGQEAQRQKIEILINQLTVQNARLVLETDRPGGQPTVFLIHSVSMQRVGHGQPMRFHAVLVNPKPIGDIDSSGTFGPFDTRHAGATPINGVYSFSHADLNTIRGIGGMLASQGSYTGRLNHIVVNGTTSTPNFSLDVSGHQLPLRTRFHAIIDGTDGDTYLEPVDAWLNHSHLVARGSVLRVKGEGHLIRLQVQVGPQADIGDMLTLAMKTAPPLMHGRLQLTTTFVLPPGRQRVPQKLDLQGRFDIANATFPDPHIQSAVDQLSLRGRGYPDAANGPLRGVKIPSQMVGAFTMQGGKLTIPAVNFMIPGADIQMHGDYTMEDATFNFSGHARMQAQVSQMVSSWWKQLLLDPINPLFSKHGAGTDVPIVVSGDRHATHVGLKIGGMTIGN